MSHAVHDSEQSPSRIVVSTLFDVVEVDLRHNNAVYSSALILVYLKII